MNKKIKNSITYIAFLGIGVLLLVLAFRGVDMEEMWTEVQKVNMPLIALSFVMGYLAIVSRGVRWLILIETLGYKAKVFNSINSVAFGYFANTFVPRSGELARCGVLNQTDDIPVDRLFGTVLSERVVDFIMLFTFMAVAFFTNADAFANLLSNASSESSGGSGGMMLLLYCGLAFLIVIVLFFVFRNVIITSRIYKKIIHFLLGVKDGLKSVLRMKRKWEFIFHTLFIWAMYFFMAYVVFLSMPSIETIELNKALFIVVAGGLGMVFPAPGGTGSYHYAVKLGFLALGMSGGLGLQFATIVWFTQTLMIILTGGVGLGFLTAFRIRKDKKKRKAEAFG